MSSETLTSTLRVGRIQYINSIPFYHGLDRDSSLSLDFYQNYPTKVNMAMRKQKINIAPISSLEYLHNQKDYYLLPNIAIGARDFSGSVILFSKKKIEQLDGQTIALSRESMSSSVLLRILMRFKYKFNNKFVPSVLEPHEMLKKHDAGLVIGDSALLFKTDEFIYRYDLSDLWWSWTEKPFCFAVWAVRKDYADQYPQEVQRFYDHLVANLERNLSDIEGLIKESLGLNFLDPKFPKVFGYLFNLNYGFDEVMQEGLLLYYRLAKRLGFSPKAKPLTFFKPGKT